MNLMNVILLFTTWPWDGLVTAKKNPAVTAECLT